MPTTLDNNKRFLYPVAQINDKDRIRKDYGDIDELATSIKDLGLLQPIVIKLDGTLIAGGRRLRAMRKLGWVDVPVTYFEVADDVTLRILEVEENVRRKQMTWQERVLAVADVHAKQFILKVTAGDRWTQDATGELLGMSRANVSYAIELATYIRAGDKEIDKCERMWDALNLIIKRKAEESNKLLAKMTLPPVDVDAARRMLLEAPLDDTNIFTPVGGPSSGSVSALQDDGEMPGAEPTGDVILVPLSKMCLHGDSVEIVKQLPDNSIDHIITDWPFGQNMEMIQGTDGVGMDVSETVNEHEVLACKELHTRIVPELFRVLKPGGYFITFTDIGTADDADDAESIFNYDARICRKVGFKVQRWPVIWHKTHRCQNRSALINFTKDYEIALVCRKGNAALLTTQASSVFMGATDEATRALKHPFAKPIKLWQWLYAAVAHKGQIVLDPFAGVGSSTLAAIDYGLQPLAIELTEKHHAASVVHVSEHYRKNLKNVKFI